MLIRIIYERILSKKRIQGFDEKKHEDFLLELNQLVLKINNTIKICS